MKIWSIQNEAVALYQDIKMGKRARRSEDGDDEGESEGM